MQNESPHYYVSVVEPINPSIAWVKRVLFSPFDMERWFTIGFGAWLASLGRPGGGGGGGGKSGYRFEELRQAFPTVEQWLETNLWWLVPTAIVGLLIFLTFYLVVLWLNCRGRFMLLHCVRHSVGEVRRPWSLYRGLAHSLFLFRLVVGFLGVTAFMIPLAVLLVLLWPLSSIKPEAIIFPLGSYATRKMAWSKMSRAASADSTSMPALMTSGPMPSAGMAAIPRPSPISS